MSVTLAELRTRALRMADMENSEFVTESEANDYVNRAAARWHSRLSLQYEDWFTTFTSFTLTGSDNIYTLPADFLQLRRLQVEDGSTASGWSKVPRGTMEDMERFTAPFSPGYLGRKPLKKYLILQNGLWILPENDPGGNYRLFYLPRYEALVNDTDAIGDWQDWSELVVIEAAILCLQKEESDTTILLQNREAAEMRIASAAKRDASEPAKVQDVDREDMW